MLADRYDLPLSTASSAAQDAYLQGCEAKLTMYPGAIEAFDRAIAADPGFALAHVARAHALLDRADAAAARRSMASAKSVAAGVSAREASHIAFFDLLATGDTEAALAALPTHLNAWPRDTMVLSTAAFTNGLIGSSGRAGQKRLLLELLDSLAPSYGDDWWFTAHHGMALSENGQQDDAGPKIDRSFLHNPNNPWAAHARAHLCYEQGDPNAARGFLASWLTTYPRNGLLYSHLNWHLALGDLEAGDAATALRLFKETFSPDVHSGPPRAKVNDAVSFLWRWELAGHGARCTISRTAHCRVPAWPFPTCTSRSRRPWRAMTRRWGRACSRWTSSRVRVVTHPAASFRQCRAPSLRSNGAISPPRSTRLNRSPASSNASAAAARSSTWWSSRC